MAALDQDVFKNLTIHTESHIISISIRDNSITKIRFSLFDLLSIFARMRRASTSLQSRLTDVITRAALRGVAGLRFVARVITCYRQIQNDRNELARLSKGSLRDIGLTENDVAVIIRRPFLVSWHSVRSCQTERCRKSAICIAKCRMTLNIFH